jgi:sucrose-6-phosphate hydrolase SacC (GH32 family)
MNQKYGCINLGMVNGDDVVPIMSREESLKYPIRFYVDDKRTLHTDAEANTIYKYDDKYKLYSNKFSVIKPFVENNQRYIMVVSLQEKLKETTLIYSCMETDNWSLR